MSVGCRNPFDNKNTTSSITGRVTDRQGNALSNATVYTDPPTTTERTNGDGSYAITNVSAGSYRLKVSKPGYVASADTVVVKDSPYACESGTIYRDVRMAVYMDTQLGSISGRVIGANGTAIDSATITMTTGEPYNYITITDTNGGFTIARVAPGDYTITAVKYGYDTAVKICTVNSGATTEWNVVMNVSSGVPIIITIAGTGVPGYSGDGGPAISAQLYLPSGIAVDGSGNVYIADWQNHRVRKIDNSGIITTIAGTGGREDRGDGGPATSAQLYLPSEVAVDNSGNIYIAGFLYFKVRKVNNAGIISTIAGTGTEGYSGDGGLATSAKIDWINGITVDMSGNIYIVCSGIIRRIDNSGIITTIAGTGEYGYSGDGGLATSAQLNRPSGVAVDGSGNIYIADYENSRIRKVNDSGIITTIAGTGEYGYSGDGGLATSAQLNYPSGVAVDGSGNVYIADVENSRIRKVDTSGIITTIAGTGIWGYSGDECPAIYAQLSGPNALAVDSSGNIYVVDFNANRTRKITNKH